mgnify:FL=1
MSCVETQKWPKELNGRLADVDLVAAEVKYHSICLSVFLQQNKPLIAQPTPDQTFDAFDQLFYQFWPELEQGKAILVSEITDMYHSLVPEGTKSSFSILRTFTTKFPQITTLEMNNKEKLVIKSDLSLADVINFAYKCKKDAEQRIQTPKSDMDRISEVPKILQKDVKRVWEPIENYDITLETVRKIIPPTLAMFLNDLAFLSDESTRQSIAHDLIALIVRQVPPKHIT